MKHQYQIKGTDIWLDQKIIVTVWCDVLHRKQDKGEGFEMTTELRKDSDVRRQLRLKVICDALNKGGE